MKQASGYKDTTNERIYNRLIPTFTLEPYLSCTPESTKNNPVDLNMHKRANDIAQHKMESHRNYDQELFFNPGSSAPWKGYSQNVNKESILRNQVYAKQKCSAAEYVPSSGSDLYNYTLDVNQVEQSHSLLFKKEVYNQCNPNPNNKQIGNSLFMNNTRTQLRGLPNK